ELRRPLEELQQLRFGRLHCRPLSRCAGRVRSAAARAAGFRALVAAKKVRSASRRSSKRGPVEARRLENSMALVVPLNHAMFSPLPPDGWGIGGRSLVASSRPERTRSFRAPFGTSHNGSHHAFGRARASAASVSSTTLRRQSVRRISGVPL